MTGALAGRLHTNQRLVVEELTRRGATVTVLDEGIELLEVRHDGRSDFLLDRFSASAPYHSVKVSADKHLTKALLRAAGVEVPDGGRFDGRSVDEALDEAARIGFPVVTKPNWGSHGDFVRTGIPDRETLAACIWQMVAAFGPGEPFVVERHHPWPEHRVMATTAGGIAIVRRDPASVLGDGISTIRELAVAESGRREALRRLGPTSLCPLALDREAADHLRREGMVAAFEHVPRDGETVPLRQQSNLAKGGVPVDVIEVAHPSVGDLAARVMSALHGLPCVGIDLLCADVTAPLSKGNHAVIEVNSNPGLAMHHYPGEGRPRDAAAMVVDAMFPWIPAPGRARLVA